MEIMSTKATHRCLIILLLATVAAGIAVYPHLPNEIASHWNVAGEADNYMGKFWGVFLFPALLAGFYLLYAIIPRIDPLKDNIRSFRSAYNLFSSAWPGSSPIYLHFRCGGIWVVGSTLAPR